MLYLCYAVVSHTDANGANIKQDRGHFWKQMLSLPCQPWTTLI